MKKELSEILQTVYNNLTGKIKSEAQGLIDILQAEIARQLNAAGAKIEDLSKKEEPKPDHSAIGESPK